MTEHNIVSINCEELIGSTEFVVGRTAPSGSGPPHSRGF